MREIRGKNYNLSPLLIKELELLKNNIDLKKKDQFYASIEAAKILKKFRIENIITNKLLNNMKSFPRVISKGKVTKLSNGKHTREIIFDDGKKINILVENFK